MTLIRFEPIREFDRLSNQIEKFFGDSQSAFTNNSFLQKVDIYETADSLVVELEAAGLNKSDFAITLEDNILKISGKKNENKSEKILKNFRSEITYGEFRRSFTLPVDVDPDKVNAKYENGVLRISLKKFDAQVNNEKNIELK